MCIADYTTYIYEMPPRQGWRGGKCVRPLSGPQPADGPAEDDVPVRAEARLQFPLLAGLREQFAVVDDDVEAIPVVAEVCPQLPLVIVNPLAQADREALGEVGGEPPRVVDSHWMSFHHWSALPHSSGQNIGSQTNKCGLVQDYLIRRSVFTILSLHQKCDGDI